MVSNMKIHVELDMDVSEPNPEPPDHLMELKFLLASACSFTFQFDDSPNVITKEQSLVVKDFEKLIEDIEIAKRIMDGLEAMFSKEAFLKKALSPTALKKEGMNFAIEQESLLRILLRVNKLQCPVFELLKHELFRVCSDTEDCCYLRLLLNPLKYLPNIPNPQDFSNDILDCLELSTVQMQLELLDSLPDIIPDSCYDCVAHKLVKLLGTNECAYEAVIECFASFDFSDDVRKTMFTSLMDKILPLRPDCVPVALNLLLDTHKGKIPLDILTKFRDMIDQIMGETHKTHLKESIIKVLQSFSYKESVVQSWLDLTNSINDPEDQKRVDLMILLILGDNTRYKEIFRRKIEAGHFTPVLLRLFLVNLEYLDGLVLSNQGLKSLVRLAGYLMKFHSSKIENFVSTMFDVIFKANMEDDRFLVDTKETVECMLKACNNTEKKCLSQTLRIFWSVIQGHPSRFFDNLNRLMGLLGRIEEFDMLSAKSAYRILCYIPYVIDPKHPYSEVMRNEISMVVRKQLMSSKRSRKAIGIMGAVSQILGLVGSSDHPVESCEVQLIEFIDPPPPSIQEAINIIESVTVLTGGIPECTGLFYDELACLAARHAIKIDFTMWMLRKTRGLLEKYIANPQKAKQTINGMEYAPRYGSFSTRKPVLLNIGPMVAEPHKYEGSPLILLAPLIGLYSALRGTGHTIYTRDFVSFLSCHSVLPDVENINNLNCDQLKQVIDSLFYTLNYLKESLSIPLQTEPSHLVKRRVKLIIKLEIIFEECLEKIPNHSFPRVYFLECTNKMQEIKTTSTPSTDHSEDKLILRREHGSQPHYFSDVHFRETVPFMDFFRIIESTGPTGNAVLTEAIIPYMFKQIVVGLRITIFDQTELTDWYHCCSSRYSSKDQLLNKFNEHLGTVTYCLSACTTDVDHNSISEKDKVTNSTLNMCISYLLDIYFVIMSGCVDICPKMREEVLTVFHSMTGTFCELEELEEFLMNNFGSLNLLCQAVMACKVAEVMLQFKPRSKPSSIPRMLSYIVRKDWPVLDCPKYTKEHFNQDVHFVLQRTHMNHSILQLSDLSRLVWLDFIDLKGEHNHIMNFKFIKCWNFHIMFTNLCEMLQEAVRIEIGSLVGRVRKDNVTIQALCGLEPSTVGQKYATIWRNVTDVIIHLVFLVHTAENDLKDILLSIFMKKIKHVFKLFRGQALKCFELLIPQAQYMIGCILEGIQLSLGSIFLLCLRSKSVSVSLEAVLYKQITYKLMQEVRKFLESCEKDRCPSERQLESFTEDDLLDGINEMPYIFLKNHPDNLLEEEEFDLCLLNLFLLQIVLRDSDCSNPNMC